MSHFVKVDDNLVVNMELVTRVEVDGSAVLLYTNGHVHSVSYDSNEDAVKGAGELTGTGSARSVVENNRRKSAAKGDTPSSAPSADVAGKH
jgi:hypothetical protein